MKQVVLEAVFIDPFSDLRHHFGLLVSIDGDSDRFGDYFAFLVNLSR